MNKESALVIEPDFDGDEKRLEFEKCLQHPSTSQLYVGRSSSTLSAQTSPQEEISSSYIPGNVNKIVSPSPMDSLPSKPSVGKIFIAKNIFKSGSSEDMPSCPPLIALNKHRHIPFEYSDGTEVIKIEKDKSTPAKTHTFNTKNVISKPPTPSHLTETVLKSLGIQIKIHKHKNNFALNSTAHNVFAKKNTDVGNKQILEKTQSQQNIHNDVHPNICNKLKSKKEKTVDLAEERIICNQRVYIPELSNDRRKIKGSKIGKQWNINEKISVSDEQDPLYIPLVQKKVNNFGLKDSGVAFSHLDEENKVKDSFVSSNNANKMKRKSKLLKISSEYHIGESTSISIDETNNLNNISSSLISSGDSINAVHPVVKNYALQNSESTSISIDETNHSNSINAPSISSGDSMNAEHSIVNNFALRRRVSKKKKENPLHSKTSSSDNSNLNSRVVDSDLIYRNRQIIGSQQKNSDCCRNFFIKNSAWDYLEPIFKGFNEREKNISESCYKYFFQLSNSLNKYEEIEHSSSENDLYYTKKIELLDKEGRLGKVLYYSLSNEIRKKRKSVEYPSYILPPTKRCKIVLERNEIVEKKATNYLLKQKLDSNLLDLLIASKDDRRKPLIILNHLNFNVLKVNETLCKHANIIYVKNIEDEFPEKLYKNSFFVSQIEKKIIKLISPEALKKYLM